MSIKENVRQLLRELPEEVLLVAAVKGRSISEVNSAIDAGITIIGENYVQETELLYKVLGKRVNWHFIGHLQKNKIKKAIQIFDMIETVDSVESANEIGRRSAEIKKIMPILIEINSGCEPKKQGVLPEKAETLIKNIASFSGIRVMGLMTMGPSFSDPEKMRNSLSETRKIFNHIKRSNIPGIEMKYLSMGMSNSYKIALEEGANIVRIGSKIFDE
jgi:PLP dependent protein